MWLPFRVDSSLMLGTTGLKYQKYQSPDTLKLTTKLYIIPFLHLAAIASGHLLQSALDLLLLRVVDYCSSAGVTENFLFSPCLRGARHIFTPSTKVFDLKTKVESDRKKG